MSQTYQSDQKVVENNLLHHHFILQSIDGLTLNTSQNNRSDIEFGEKMHVSGMMCNRFFGQGQLKDGMLMVKDLATTRKMCADPQQNQWDQTIKTVLANGAKLSLDGQTLILNGSGHQLVYTLKDWVQ